MKKKRQIKHSFKKPNLGQTKTILDAARMRFLTKLNQTEIEKLSDDCRTEIRRRQDLLDCAKSTQLLGKCYKTKNSYSADRPDWWLYGIVCAIKDNDPIMFRFQWSSDNKLEFGFEQQCYSAAYVVGNYIEITKAEFVKALRHALNKAHKEIEKLLLNTKSMQHSRGRKPAHRTTRIKIRKNQ
jgi:hypothetical protein